MDHNTEFDYLLRRVIEQRSDATIPEWMAARVISRMRRQPRQGRWLWVPALTAAAAAAGVIIVAGHQYDEAEPPQAEVPPFYSELTDIVETRLEETLDISGHMRDEISRMYPDPEQQ